MLGLGLDADAVRALHVAAHDGPHDADQEHQAGEVADEAVGHVGAAVQELQALGQLVVDLEHGGDAEQRQEPEVDHRVHQAGGGVAQQGLHVGAGAEVAQAVLHVLGGGRAAVGGATLPVAHAVGERERAPDQQHRDDRVERHLQGAGDAVEHFAGRLLRPCQCVNCGMMPEASVNRPMKMPTASTILCGVRYQGFFGPASVSGDVWLLIVRGRP